MRSGVLLSSLMLLLFSQPAPAREIHVSVQGDDHNDGSPQRPLRTISAAAELAQPGDVVTVHAGTYRERVAPPRGGESDERRIVYRAAPGEEAIIKGSEVMRGWKNLAPGVWKLTVPNTFFGAYNPYKDVITGDWFDARGRVHHTGEVYLNGKSLWETHLLERVFHPEPQKDARLEGSTYTWFTESDEKNTYIYANFHDKDPNRELVEINVRDACFYPAAPGRDYITVRGFRIAHAATQWAAPTAEQIGAVGTHWSKGWIIEDNVISDSKCTCVTLGKDRATGHNVWSKDPSKDGAIHYVETIRKALAAGWSRETIGSHEIRNNTIFNCEQAGIAGSLGAVFSRITNNHIYDVWAKRQFAGAEMGGIKLHAAIDVLIAGNRIHNAGRGLWMDWMAQGTRISGNLLYENTTDDLFVEVDHGPFLVDNNLFLSPVSLRDWSEGGAYVHNLFAGIFATRPEPFRSTPYHKAHSTEVVAIVPTWGSDNRFYNNVFIGRPDPAPLRKPPEVDGYGLVVYDKRYTPPHAGGNVYFDFARPYSGEEVAGVLKGGPSQPAVADSGAEVAVELKVPPVKAGATRLVTTEMLGKTAVSGLPFENPDGTPLVVDRDYFGAKRDAGNPGAGPFAQPGGTRIKVWPVAGSAAK